MNREVHVRFWESARLKCLAPLVYLHEMTDGFVAERVIGEWIDFYNTRRPPYHPSIFLTERNRV
jgi:hypothetical protein